jgi:predicted O-methyltransferase YrrM
MIAVSQLKGNFASLIATSSSTKNLLEIGTLGGYSTIWFAQALQGKGTVTSIEIDPFRRDIAAENLEFGGFRPKDVNVILGAALDVLPQLASEIQQGKREPFDFVFIDCGLGKSVELL